MPTHFSPLFQNKQINRPQEQDELWGFLKGKSDAARAEAESAKKAAEEAAAARKKPEEQEEKKRKAEEQPEEPSTPVGGGKQKKQKKMEKEEEKVSKEEDAASTFPWAKTIKKTVKKADGKQLSRKALQKQVLALALEANSGGGADKKELKRTLKAVLDTGVAGVKVEGDVVLYSK